MIMELRKKSQITIPKDLIINLGLKEGDMLDIIEENGEIRIVPVVVYNKKYVDELKSEITEIKSKIKNGTQPLFNSVDELFNQLDL